MHLIHSNSFLDTVRCEIYNQPRVHCLEVDCSATIKNIKAMLTGTDKDGVPLHLQTLLLDGIAMEDDHALNDYNIMQESTLHLQLQSNSMQIFVKLHNFQNNKLATFKVVRAESVMSLKIKIKDKTDIPESEQLLFFVSKLLHDEHSLHEYSLQEGSTLYMHMKIKQSKQ